MKKLSILYLLTFCLGQSLFSQTNSDPFSQTYSDDNTENKIDKHFYFGVGFGIGLFYPGDVNDYIIDHTSHLLMAGVEEIFLNYVGRVSLTYKVNKTIAISMIGEYALAPKYIVVEGSYDDIFYHFDRFSPGLIAKFHIPIKSGQNSIFFAPGLLYNSMKFEEFKAKALGFRLEAGLSFNFSKVNLQPFLSYDFAKAIDESYSDFELNYSGIQIGVDFNF